MNIKLKLLPMTMIGVASLGAGVYVGAEEASKGATAEHAKADAAKGESHSKEEGDKAAPAKDGAEAPAAETQAVAEQNLPSGCLVDAASLEDLKKKRAEIDARARVLESQAKELESQKKALEGELSRLEQAKKDIEALRAGVRKENEEKITKLVETFETMSPKSASQVLSGLEVPLAVAAMSRISTAKLAKIMAAMETEKSVILTEALAGVTRSAEAKQNSRSPSSTDGEKKGGT